jgi:hypothetical protein
MLVSVAPYHVHANVAGSRAREYVEGDMTRTASRNRMHRVAAAIEAPALLTFGGCSALLKEVAFPKASR